MTLLSSWTCRLGSGRIAVVFGFRVRAVATRPGAARAGSATPFEAEVIMFMGAASGQAVATMLAMRSSVWDRYAIMHWPHDKSQPECLL